MFVSSLNDEQKRSLHDFDSLNLELLIAHEKVAIQYMLELIDPEI